MGYLVLVLLILSTLSPLNSEDLHPVDEENMENMLTGNQESRETMPLANSVEKENEKGATAVGISYINTGLSQENLIEIHDLAKNISHSKGIYIENVEDTSNEPEVRRSVLKKATISSESDIMKTVVERLRTAENKVQLLEQLEFLVHQYDVGVNFAALGGIKLIAPLLFSSDEKVASIAASVLGSAMQSNPTVQKFAMDDGSVKILVELLTHKSPDVLSRVVFALASLLRNVPEAQGEFISINGVSKLVELLKSLYVTTNTKLKIVNLFSDIMIEHQTANMYDSNKRSEENEALQRSFEAEIQKYEICKLIPTFLDFEDLDTHQKTVAAMISLYSTCHDDFKERKIINRLLRLAKLYNSGSDERDPIYPDVDEELKDDLFLELKDLVTLIMDEDDNTEDSELVLKDEL